MGKVSPREGQGKDGDGGVSRDEREMFANDKQKQKGTK
jgi:hypothetical protein